MNALSLNSNSITAFWKSSKSAEAKWLEKVIESPTLPDISRRKKDKKLDNLKKSRKSNELSRNSQKKLKKKVNWLCFASEQRNIKLKTGQKIRKFRSAMITLHLPGKQMHDHSLFTSKCLNNFLNLLRQKHNLKNYIWKVELQKNGKIHYHVVVDIPVPHEEVRKYWNSSLELLGYVTRYHHRFSKMTYNEYRNLRKSQGESSEKKILQGWNYGNESNWKSPNCTDIHSLKKVKNAAAYVAKYLSKKSHEGADRNYQESLKKLTGRLWGCSQSLSRLNNLVVLKSPLFSMYFEVILKLKSSKVLVDEWFTHILFDISKVPIHIKDWLLSLLWDHVWKSKYPVPFVNHNT